MKLTFGQLKELFPNHNVGLADDQLVQGICHDTRRLKAGDIYIAIRGQNFDGHDFVEEAFNKGALAVIVEGSVSKGLPAFCVKDSIQALADLARFYREQFSQPVVAITGSSGKTTTKDLLVHVLKTTGKVVATQGNLNNHIGVPLTVFSFVEDADYFVVEMGMSSFGEIEHLAHIVQPDYGVITSIGPAHLEGVGGTLEGVAKAKGELFLAMKQQGMAFVFDSEPLICDLPTQAQRVFYGFKQSSEYHAEGIQVSDSCTDFVLRHEDQSYEVSLPLLGKHHVQNAVAVSALCHKLGLQLSDIQKALMDFEIDEHRGSHFSVDQHVFIDDVYNANPSSMQVNIRAVAEAYPSHHKIAVLGDMLELGDSADRWHREIGELLHEVGVDALFCIGEHTKSYFKGFDKDVGGYSDTHDDLANKLKDYLESQENACVVFVKGSRGMQMEKILRHFR